MISKHIHPYLISLPISLIFLICRITASAQLQVPDEKQLVTYYQAATHKSLFNIDRWKLEVQEQTTMEGTFAKTTPQKYIRKHTVYRDGDRVDTRTQLTEVFKDEMKETRFQNVIFGGRSYFYDHYLREDEQLKWLIVNNETTITFLNCAGIQARAFAGYMLGDIKPLSDILAEKSSVLKVRPSMENVNGCSTYVLEADTIYGHYTVWMDPNSGYNPRRVVVERDTQNLLAIDTSIKKINSQTNNQLTAVNPRPGRPSFERITEVMDIHKIQEIGGDFFTTAGTTTTTRVYSDGSVKKFHTVCEISMIDFNPDFNDIPGIFLPDVPNGTKVHDDNRPTGKFIWLDGKVVSLVTEPQSIIGKPLPDINDLKITLSPDDINNKSMLMCFYDMQQRPSRNCMKQLSKKAEELKEKDIIVVAIQATKVDEKVLDKWLKENDLPFPAGMIRADEEKTRIKWGVRSLPWLILTDKQHIVMAEGFSLEELNDKIKASR